MSRSISFRVAALSIPATKTCRRGPRPDGRVDFGAVLSGYNLSGFAVAQPDCLGYVALRLISAIFLPRWLVSDPHRTQRLPCYSLRTEIRPMQAKRKRVIPVTHAPALKERGKFSAMTTPLPTRMVPRGMNMRIP